MRPPFPLPPKTFQIIHPLQAVPTFPNPPPLPSPTPTPTPTTSIFPSHSPMTLSVMTRKRDLSRTGSQNGSQNGGGSPTGGQSSGSGSPNGVHSNGGANDDGHPNGGHSNGGHPNGGHSNGGHTHHNSSGKEEFHLAMLGEVGVGKSALTVKYITKRYINEYDPTLEGTYKKIDSIDSQEAVVHLMDTYDKEGRNPDRYLKWADAFVVVYSITCRSSFDRARAFLDTLANYHRITAKEKPVVLVGNKMDLERYRQVSKSEGSSLAAQHECAFFESSAAEEYVVVQNVFHAAVRDVIRERVSQMPLQPLIIMEDENPKHSSPLKVDKTPSNTLPRTVSRSGSSQKQMVKLPPGDSKSEKTKGNFKFFNRGFKIFN